LAGFATCPYRETQVVLAIEKPLRRQSPYRGKRRSLVLLEMKRGNDLGERLLLNMRTLRCAKGGEQKKNAAEEERRLSIQQRQALITLGKGKGRGKSGGAWNASGEKKGYEKKKLYQG